MVDNVIMLNNISILTEEQLDDAVDQLVEAVEEYMETYGHDADDVDDKMMITVAEELGVNPTPQVLSIVEYRIQQMFS